MLWSHQNAMKKINSTRIESNIASDKWQRIEKGIFLIGRRYHILYSIHGKSRRESTSITFESPKKTNIEIVRRILASRKGDIATGKFPFLKV